MPLNRSPIPVPSTNENIGSGSIPMLQDNESIEDVNIVYPTQRAAAITRVRNEINPLLNNLALNEHKVVELLKKHNNKMVVFSELCEEELFTSADAKNKHDFIFWRDQKMTEAKKYQEQCDKLLEDYRIDDVGESASVAGENKEGSTVSSVRVKIIEEKARVQAERKYFEESVKLEQEQIKLRNALRDLELKKREEENKTMEEAVSDLQSNSGCKDNKNHDSFHSIIETQNKMSLKILEAQQRSFLPRHLPDKFDGTDITVYRKFKLSFMQMIERYCHEEERYHYLLQYTGGHPHQLVSSCYSFDLGNSYYRAFRLLDEKYGNSYLVAQEYLKKVRAWPDVPYDDGKALEDLSLFLSGCANTMESVSELRQLNNHEEIKLVIDKLPTDLRKAWRSHAVSVMEQDVVVDFGDLNSFVSRQSRILNTPIFGNIKAEKKREANKVINEVKHRAMATVTDLVEEVKFCHCCKKAGSHDLDKCYFFKRRSYDERSNFVRERGLCYGCLSVDHNVKDCQNKLTCSICSQQHPTSLHKSLPVRSGPRDDNSEEGNENSNRSVALSIKCNYTNHKHEQVLSPAVPVLVRLAGSLTVVRTYLALDSWASDCFISTELLERLNGKGLCSTVKLATMGNISTIDTKIVNGLEILSLDGALKFNLPDTFALRKWPFQLTDSPCYSNIEQFDHLRNINFDFISEPIGLLVGANVPELIKTLETVSGRENEPYATRHALGWAITGNVHKELINRVFCHRTRVECNDSIENKFADMFARDFKDIEPEVKGYSVEDNLWLKKVTSSIKRRDEGNYEIALPFRKNDFTLPCNYKQAFACFMGLNKRFHRDGNFFEDYNDFVQNMITRGYLELVPENELNKVHGQRWFLVHHGVYHKNKNKIRVVFDCSKKNAGVSLNDVLLKGPDLINNLIGVLLRFRVNKIAVMADIESMFMQVKVPPAQTDYMRIFWYDKNGLKGEVVQYRLTSHTFGAISSPSIAGFALRQAAIDNRARMSTDAFDAITRCTYVDDVMCGASNENNGVKLLRELREIASFGGFNLTGIVSNSREVLSSFPSNALSKQLREFDLAYDSLPTDRALGVLWDVETDGFKFQINLSEKPLTRRGMLSAICSIFDPLGLVNPVVVVARSLFQETCRRKLQWDDVLPYDLRIAWVSWIEKLRLLEAYTVDRCLIGNLQTRCHYQIHIFCDGSLKAYGAVAYLRSVDGEGHVRCTLLVSKVRQTPIGNSSLRTVPRIELNSAKMAVLLKQLVDREMSFDCPVRFWSDSMTVIKYINNESVRFHRYVENRVNFIRSHSSPNQWCHVPGKINIADVLSRGIGTREFCNCLAWKNGPSFLWKDEAYWPPHIEVSPVENEDAEVKKESRVASISNVTNCNTFGKLLEGSSWSKILYRISVFVSFRNYLKSKCLMSPFSYEIMSEAEPIIWRYVQSSYYRDQVNRVSKGRNLLKGDSLEKFSPFIDKAGLMRVGGRLQQSLEPYATAHPVILPGRAAIVRLMIINFHIKIGHMGKHYLLSSLRCKYWIVNVRVVINDILKSCIQCRKQNGRPGETMMSSLPSHRVTGNRPPFYAVGIDFFGPFLTTKGRATEKRYGVVFTCLASRAVHFEISFSLTTDSFINSLRRFIARRGQVKVVYSDNGTNLVGGCRELRRSIARWNSDAINRQLSQSEIEWHFNPPHASHYGGAWEREIRTARKILLAIINDQKHILTDELLVTFMCEVESIMNSRPLTPVSDDIADLRALTPNHVLLVATELNMPPGGFDTNSNYLKSRWRRVQHLSETFWLRWRKEYLRQLNERQKWHRKNTPLKEGDLVLLSDVLLPRNQWSMGRVISLNASADGNVRSVNLRVARHKPGTNLHPATTSVIERPITKLIYLMSE